MICGRPRLFVLMLVGCHAFGTVVRAAPPQKAEHPLPRALAERAQQAVDRGLAFLRSTQDKEGGWTAQYGPAVTAIVGRAFALDPNHGPQHPVVRRAIAYTLRFEQADGGIYDRGQNLANYQTAVVLMFLAHLDDPAHRDRIVKTQTFLKRLQFDPAESVEPDNPWYGGAGYNTAKRPDLSNTQMMLEALHQSGLPKDDPAYRRALRFVSRCQMHDPTNDQPFADGATDGGFIYSSHGGGESKASEDQKDGTSPLRSYGSMTYSGFKSMLYADLSRDDPRIKACLRWIRNHWTLDHNPGMPKRRSREGLFYYFNVFSKAMSAWGAPMIVDAAGRSHDWRKELCQKLISLQKTDGSWVNDQPRWLEGDANYVTALAILSLQTALKQDKPAPTATAPAEE